MELTGLVMNSMRKYSFRMGDRFFYLALCHHWDAAGVAPRRSHYSGPFDMVDGTLDTPILVLSWVNFPFYTEFCLRMTHSGRVEIHMIQ